MRDFYDWLDASGLGQFVIIMTIIFLVGVAVTYLVYRFDGDYDEDMESINRWKMILNHLDEFHVVDKPTNVEIGVAVFSYTNNGYVYNVFMRENGTGLYAIYGKAADDKHWAKPEILEFPKYGGHRYLKRRIIGTLKQMIHE